jgi:D-alanine transaminase
MMPIENFMDKNQKNVKTRGMTQIIYVNGIYHHNHDAKIHISDRGYQFADAAYEVILFVNQLGFDIDLHLARLSRTLDALQIQFTMTNKAMIMNMHTLMQKNHIKTGLVYIQISRGVAPRNFAFPKKPIQPTLVMTTKALNLNALLKQKEKKLKLTLLPDNRWGRCDLKTVGLLPSVLATQHAIDNGFDDALLYDEHGITEGTSWNFWIVTKDGCLQTRPLGVDILHGITRHTVLEIAKSKNIPIIEKPITHNELSDALEAFATSATKMVMSIQSVDNIVFDNKNNIATALYEAYLKKFYDNF